jgi:SSS family solute:Na+ symporter
VIILVLLPAVVLPLWVLRATKVDPGVDQTRWDDFTADADDEGVSAELDPHAPVHA